MSQQPYDFIPLWAVYVITALILFVAVEAGYLLSKRMRQRKPDRPESEIVHITLLPWHSWRSFSLF